MITREKYLDYINTHDVLEQRVYKVAKLLNRLDSKQWEMFSETGDIYFYTDSVSLNTSEYFRGSYDSTSMSFNSDYLFMTDEEITEDANRIIEEVKERARMIKEARDREILAAAEKKEREEFERLKKKYDNQKL